jgi:transposase
MTIADVAQHLKMSWNTVKEIQRLYLRRHYSKPRLKNVRYIAIDEFAVQKGHQYMTVVYDLEAGRALYVGEGREADVLKPFWKRLKSSGARLKAIAMDMWPAYISSVGRNAHQVPIVFDRFHIIKKMNEALDATRRLLYREQQLLNKGNVIKGLRWLLLKNEDHLDATFDEKKRLEEALALNQPLAAVYYLKEELRLLWQQPDTMTAERFLTHWSNKARATTLQPLIKFCNMLMGHRSGVLNWFTHRISSGPLEGFNNKIKVLKRRAYGYRDHEFFILKILALHQTKYALL